MDTISSISCLYGSVKRTNKEIFQYHVLSAIFTVSLAPMLLFNSNLLRLYAPLAKVVSYSILLQILSDCLYFMYYPYAENEGNCAEILTGRICSALIMFGELHQIYLLANMLGLGSHRFKWGERFSVTLNFALKMGSVLVAMSLVYSAIFRVSFRWSRNIWTIFAASLQIYFVWLSGSLKNEMTNESNLLSSMQSSVRVFDKLSKLQLFPAMVCVLERLLEMNGVTKISQFDNVVLILNEVLNLLFYLKVLLIQENADLNVELVDA